MGALWGLLAASLIGCADSAARVSARRIPIFQLVFFTTWVSLPIGILLFDWPGLGGAVHVRAALLACIGGFLHVAVLLFLYRALADGPVSVAVAGAASSVVFLITWNVLAGEPWHFLQLVAGACLFLAVGMTIRPERGLAEARHVRRLRATALFGLGAGFFSSVRLFLMQEATDELGPGSAILAMRVGAAISVSLGMLILARGNLRAVRVPTRFVVLLVVLQAVLETLAILVLLYGSVSAGRVGAAVGFAAVPAASTVAARMFLGDPIGRRRGWWILVVVGCVMVATLARTLSAE